MVVIVPGEADLDEKTGIEYCKSKIERYKVTKAGTFFEAPAMTPTGNQYQVLKKQLAIT